MLSIHGIDWLSLERVTSGDKVTFCLIFYRCILFYFKDLDTFGNCQRPVFSLGVSQHMHYKITNLNKFRLNCRRSCGGIVEEKDPYRTSCVRDLS